MDLVGASVVRVLLSSGGSCAVWASHDSHTGRATPYGLVDRLDKPALPADGRARWLAAMRKFHGHARNITNANFALDFL